MWGWLEWSRQRTANPLFIGSNLVPHSNCAKDLWQFSENVVKTQQDHSKIGLMHFATNEEICGFKSLQSCQKNGDSYTECGASSIGGILIKCYTQVQFLPLGPMIYTGVDYLRPLHLRIVNKKLLQKNPTYCIICFVE